MKQYIDLAKHVLENGEKREDRTGTGTLSVFGYQNRYDLSKGFPLLTTKRVPFRLIVSELLWFIKGETNISYLLDENNHIWDADAYRWFKQRNPNTELSKEEYLAMLSDYEQYPDFHYEGNLGPIYGKQWRAWGKDRGYGFIDHIDQLKELIEGLKQNPQSRRHIVSAWNAGQLENMALPPCHIFFQCYIHNDGRLDLHMYQRSADIFLGVPFNIASYSLLLLMLAHVTGLQAGEFIHSFGDAHIYLNHIDQVKEQIKREPKELPTIWLNPDIKNIDDFTMEDIKLLDYNPHPPIKGDVSVG